MGLWPRSKRKSGGGKPWYAAIDALSGMGLNMPASGRGGPKVPRCLYKELTVQIKISTRHGHVSDGTQAKIRDKVERLGRYVERLTAIEVTVNLERKEQPSVDLRASADHKHDFVATAEAESILAAMDLVVEKMEQQLRKYKEKVQDRHRSTSHRQSPEPSDLGPETA